MTYEIDLPDDLYRRLLVKASATGDEVGHLIRVAIGEVVSEGDATASNSGWSEQGETRRRELIDRDIAGTLSAAELAELGFVSSVVAR